MMKKMKWILPMLAVLFLVMAPIAEAHVTVHPSESSINAYEKYTVRVPVEKDIHTTEVKLDVPEGINLISILPMSDWGYELEKDENDLITSVIWIANDGGIGVNEFMEFSFIGANPGEPGEFSWEAYQTYEDGSVVEWIGPPDSGEPASVLEIVTGDTVAPHGDNETSDANHTDQEEPTESSSTDSGSTSWLPIVLASIAILLSIISLFRKRT